MKESISRKGNCLDNSCIESFFGHLKAECFYLSTFTTMFEIEQAIHEYIEFYNTSRCQKKLHNLSPVEYRVALYEYLLDGGQIRQRDFIVPGKKRESQEHAAAPVIRETEQYERAFRQNGSKQAHMLFPTRSSTGLCMEDVLQLKASDVQRKKETFLKGR